MRLKPLHEQVAVVIGASSGIGREVARRFAHAGAKVVAAARGEEGLRSLVDEIDHSGGSATHVVCDVADAAAVEAVAAAAVDRFGRVDTWVNNAAVSVYAKVWETTPEEYRRTVEVNFLGQVHGALAALPRLREAGGGALIMMSSVESMVGLPLHAAYSASKHAVEGFTEALRRELMADGVPISVTSVKPATINTPFFDNARNKMDVKPKGPPPYYEPAVVADCVLYAAETPVRDMYAGGAAKMMAVTQKFAPGLVDAVLARVGIPASRTAELETGNPGNLDAPRPDDRTRGRYDGAARRTSLYTYLETHPPAKAAVIGGAVLGTALLLARGAGDHRMPPRRRR